MSYVSWKEISLKEKLNAADTSLEADIDVWITTWRIYWVNDLQEEWLEFTGVAANWSNYTYSGLTRWLSQTADPATAWTWLTWKAWSIWTIVAMHDQLFDRQKPEATVFATTAARDAALWGDWVATKAWVNIYVTATWLHYNYNLSTNQWESVDSWTVTPNASEITAGKVEIATDAQILTNTLIWETGALLVRTNDKFIPQEFWNWSDWTVVISSNTSLTRDMYYDNLTINATQTLTTAWFRIFVKDTFINNGIVDYSGNNWGNGWNWTQGSDSATTAWTWWSAWTGWTALTSGTLFWSAIWTAWSTWWAWGIWATGNNVWNPWIAWSKVNWASIAQTLNTTTTPVIWVNWAVWWAWWANLDKAWWAWWALWWTSIAWVKTTAKTLISNYMQAISMLETWDTISILKTTAHNWWSTSWSWGWWAWWDTWFDGRWGWGWGWSWGNGSNWGLIAIYAKIITNNWVISSVWGNGWNGWNWGRWWNGWANASAGWWGWSGSGWNGWNWGIVVLVYKSITLWTITLTGWTGWTAWTPWAAWAIWTGNSEVWIIWGTGISWNSWVAGQTYQLLF